MRDGVGGAGKECTVDTLAVITSRRKEGALETMLSLIVAFLLSSPTRVEGYLTKRPMYYLGQQRLPSGAGELYNVNHNHIRLTAPKDV